MTERNIYDDDDSSDLSQQASGTCNTSQLPPDRLLQSLTGAAAQNTTCEYHTVHDVPNGCKPTTRILVCCKGMQVCNR